MSDYFALLDQPRRPWLDAEALKARFLLLSANLHPDRVHGGVPAEKARAQEVYAELNAAYQCLRDPRERVRHLLELERGGKLEQVQKIPADLMNVSLEVGQACRETDTILADKTKATSPLLQVEVFERSQPQAERLTALVTQLDARRESLLTELRRLDADWVGQPVGELARPDAQRTRLEEIYRLLTYYERWSSHLRERIVQLAL